MNTFVVFPHLLKLHAHDALVNCLCDIEVEGTVPKKGPEDRLPKFHKKIFACCLRQHVCLFTNALIKLRSYTAKTLACMPIYMLGKIRTLLEWADLTALKR